MWDLDVFSDNENNFKISFGEYEGCSCATSMRMAAFGFAEGYFREKVISNGFISVIVKDESNNIECEIFVSIKDGDVGVY